MSNTLSINIYHYSPIYLYSASRLIIPGVGVVEAMADLKPSVLVKGVGVNLIGLEISSWTLLKLRKGDIIRLVKLILIRDHYFLKFKNVFP